MLYTEPVVEAAVPAAVVVVIMIIITEAIIELLLQVQEHQVQPAVVQLQAEPATDNLHWRIML